MKPDEHAEALVALIEAERAARCRETDEPAAREARALVAAARASARKHVAAVIAGERAVFAARVAAAEARLATARRMARQRRLKALLAQAWERLPQVLVARWADAGPRARWIDAALGCAGKVLPAGERRIEAAAGDARLASAADIQAGVRVRSGRVTMDATLAGLLADRLAVEGRLLHFFGEDGA